MARTDRARDKSAADVVHRRGRRFSTAQLGVAVCAFAVAGAAGATTADARTTYWDQCTTPGAYNKPGNRASSQYYPAMWTVDNFSNWGHASTPCSGTGSGVPCVQAAFNVIGTTSYGLSPMTCSEGAGGAYVVSDIKPGSWLYYGAEGRLCHVCEAGTFNKKHHLSLWYYKS
jgi:hypothetical protein